MFLQCADRRERNERYAAESKRPSDQRKQPGAGRCHGHQACDPDSPPAPRARGHEDELLRGRIRDRHPSCNARYAVKRESLICRDRAF
jgi:hypothetical protein